MSSHMNFEVVFVPANLATIGTCMKRFADTRTGRVGWYVREMAIIHNTSTLERNTKIQSISFS